jgi:hypothetical protein
MVQAAQNLGAGYFLKILKGKGNIGLVKTGLREGIPDPQGVALMILDV